MKVSYSSNNSGGCWWLTDQNWIDLEKAGWTVDWGEYLAKGGTLASARKKRYLGGLAASASKDFQTIRDALVEFEKITGQDVSDEGCNCCGPPHNFSWDDHSASGEGLLQYMTDKPIPKNLREALGL